MNNNRFDPNDFFPYAESNSTFGTIVGFAVNGLGLVTRGLIWQAFDIWFNLDAHDGIATTWASSNVSVTTIWTSSNASITTPWAACAGGIFGELPP